jgi:DNA repair protein RadC
MIPMREWPLGERPRERLLAVGPEGLAEAELLALVLGSSSRDCGGVVEVARALLARFGGLDGLARARAGELMQLPGIGAARACAVAGALELGRRLDGAAVRRGDPMSCAADVHRALRWRLALLEHETFWVIALDAKHRALALRQVAQGSATSVEVHPREVFGVAVREAAASVIVAHNHPSGDPEPSAEDRELTLRLRRASEILGIPLLDHIVIAAGGYVSLASRGVITPT